MIMPSV